MYLLPAPTTLCASLRLYPAASTLEEFVKMQFSSDQGIRRESWPDSCNWPQQPQHSAGSAGGHCTGPPFALTIALPDLALSHPCTQLRRKSRLLLGPGLTLMLKNIQSGAWLFRVLTMPLCLASSPLQLLSWQPVPPPLLQAVSLIPETKRAR